jgi:hypothetical protein
MKLFFNYLWKGSVEYLGSHLSNWKSLSKPKKFGGWGLKDTWLFGKASITKSLWIFITRDNLWRLILMEKYIAPDTILDWVQRTQKRTHKVSNQWKALSLVFPIIRRFLALKVGTYYSVRIGMHAIIGCGDGIFFLECIVSQLQDLGRRILNRIKDGARTTI